MTDVTEVAPDLFRLCTWIPEANLQFCQFLVRDDEPLLFHTGLRGIFPLVRDAVARVLDPASVRWVAFSHFEDAECGSRREWPEVRSDRARAHGGCDHGGRCGQLRA